MSRVYFNFVQYSFNIPQNFVLVPLALVAVVAAPVIRAVAVIIVPELKVVVVVVVAV